MFKYEFFFIVFGVLLPSVALAYLFPEIGGVAFLYTLVVYLVSYFHGFAVRGSESNEHRDESQLDEIARTTNYVADDEVYPSEVVFQNGRRVKSMWSPFGYYLEVGWSEGRSKGALEESTIASPTT